MVRQPLAETSGSAVVRKAETPRRATTSGNKGVTYATCQQESEDGEEEMEPVGEQSW